MNKYDVFESKFAQDIFLQKYSMDGLETWSDTCNRVVNAVCGNLITPEQKETIFKYMLDRKFIPAGRYLFSSGRPKHQINNCFMMRAVDSKEGWSKLMGDITIALMTGGGLGVDYSALREEGAVIKGSGGKSTGPIALMHMVNEAGRYIMQGGSRRSAIWAGLNWKHPDIYKFMGIKNWTEEMKALKAKDFNYPMPMEGTNISVIYDTEWFIAIEDKKHPLHKLAKDVYMKNCRQAFETAEPAWSFNFLKDNESLRNACNELISEDNSDRCNLGSIWINRIDDKEEFIDIIKHSTLFLLCGGIYSDNPTKEIEEVGKANNRIGLGLGGIHEWLMKRGMQYECTPELHKWMAIFKEQSDAAAYIYAKQLGVNIPKGKRALAPNGTIGLLAESTTSAEPLFCAAYKRRYLVGNVWKYQYVIDGSVKRLLNAGVSIDNIQDAYSLKFKDRVKFQADLQNYIDHAISSTCNLPQWGSDGNNEKTLPEYSKILLKYARRLRGFTVYPDGCRSGQPLTTVPLAEALAQEGIVFEEKVQECTNGVCGI